MTDTSWLLGSGYPWYSLDGGPSTVVANDVNGLSLATLAQGALGLTAPDGSLGRLVLPRGVAIDGDCVLVLSDAGTLVYRYDSVRATLVPLPEVGAQGLSSAAHAAELAFTEPRRFRGATSIATFQGALYVADPQAHRVQVFDVKTLTLLRIHALQDPIDVTSGSQGVYIADRGHGEVYRAHPLSDSLVRVVSLAAEDAETAQLVQRARGWQRLAVDLSERLYLSSVDTSGVSLDVFVLKDPLPVTFATERVYDSSQVRDRFSEPAIIGDEQGGLALPERLLDPCGLRQPLAPATPRWQVGDRLYVADLGTRALVVYLADGQVRHRFAPLNATGVEVAPDDTDAWRISDVVKADGCALILDELHQIVYAHYRGSSSLRRWFSAPPDAPRHWQQVALDKAGCLLFWDGASATVDRLDARGASLGAVPLRDVRTLFSRQGAALQPARSVPSVSLTRRGAIPRPAGFAPVWPKPLYCGSGVWTSQWLDSRIYDCVWHVIELAIAKLPPGSTLQIRTRTTNQPPSAGVARDNAPWQDTPILVGDPQPDPTQPQSLDRDFLVQSQAGQYLQLQVLLTGNAIDTPVLSQARLRFPRESLLQYLPAIYSSPSDQHDFLERVLSIMQTTWTGIENQVDTFQRYLDPKSVPPEAMAWLAGWLNVSLEGGWTPEQNRKLLLVMPGLRTRWGTVEGLREWVRVYLSNLGNVSVDDLAAAGIPGIVESFVQRRRVLLSAQGPALAASGGLWSPSVERRFQIGVFDEVGKVELVSTGEPELGLFQQYAYSFQVYVPAAFVRTPQDEALLRRAIELQKPAHATYELVLLEPRFLIGEQSTIELDTIIGDALPGHLTCAAVLEAPSRAPHQRLGFDATLASGTNSATGVGRGLM